MFKWDNRAPAAWTAPFVSKVSKIFSTLNMNSDEKKLSVLSAVNRLDRLEHCSSSGGKSQSGNWKVAGANPELCLAKCQRVPEQDTT